jgi:hypothetical protein
MRIQRIIPYIRKGDACDVDMTTTIVAADGSLTRETWAVDPKAPIDCFYVYPTVSVDATPNSDMSQDPAEKNVVLQQFARFASKCRASGFRHGCPTAGCGSRSGNRRPVPAIRGRHSTLVRLARQTNFRIGVGFRARWPRPGMGDPSRTST